MRGRARQRRPKKTTTPRSEAKSDLRSSPTISPMAMRTPTSLQPKLTVNSPGDLQSMLPGYSQESHTCGAASLVTALMVWDREYSKPDMPHELVVTAINLILTWLVDNYQAKIDGWNKQGIDGEGLYQKIDKRLKDIRNAARRSDSTISEIDYQDLSSALYALYMENPSRGLSISQILSLHSRLGLNTGQSDARVNRFHDIVASPLLNELKPGQIAQVAWYTTRTNEQNEQGQYAVRNHAFIIGRFKRGEWFLSDQGMQPSTELIAPDYITLMRDLVHASNVGKSSILTSDSAIIILGAWTGIKLLAGPGAVLEKAAGLIPPRTYLGKVDAGFLTIGDKIYSGQFISRHYSRSDAHLAAEKITRSGVLIVEMPEGVFNIYETGKVRTRNVGVQSLDNPEGGLLTRKTFFSAELVLTDGKQTNLIHVY